MFSKLKGLLIGIMALIFGFSLNATNLGSDEVANKIINELANQGILTQLNDNDIAHLLIDVKDTLNQQELNLNEGFTSYQVSQLIASLVEGLPSLGKSVAKDLKKKVEGAITEGVQKALKQVLGSIKSKP